MHHKRRKRKNVRAGCLMCKFWKQNGFGKGRRDSERYSDHKRRKVAKEKVDE